MFITRFPRSDLKNVLHEDLLVRRSELDMALEEDRLVRRQSGEEWSLLTKCNHDQLHRTVEELFQRVEKKYVRRYPRLRRFPR